MVFELAADIVASRIRKQCSLPPLRAKRGFNWRKVRQVGDVLCKRSQRLRHEYDGGERFAGSTEWSVGNSRLRIKTTPDGRDVEVRLYQRGSSSRLLPLVDGRLSDADAEAVKLRFETEAVAARFA